MFRLTVANTLHRYCRVHGNCRSCHSYRNLVPLSLFIVVVGAISIVIVIVVIVIVVVVVIVVHCSW